MWVRGLKLALLGLDISPYRVAPRVGAWIEIYWNRERITCLKVAPRVGAWIEMVSAFLHYTAATRRTPCGCVD